MEALQVEVLPATQITAMNVLSYALRKISNSNTMQRVNVKKNMLLLLFMIFLQLLLIVIDKMLSIEI